MAYYPTSPGPNLVVVPEPARHIVVAPPVHPAEKHKNAFTLVGVFQVLIGIICAIMGGVLASQYEHGSTSNTGIGAGVLYVITGALALSTGSRPTNCNVVGGMVLAIFSAISAGATTGVAAWALVALKELEELEDVYYSLPSSVMAIIGTLCALCGLEFILAIVHSAYCCTGSCCGSENRDTMVLQVPQASAAPPAYGQTNIPYKAYTNDPDV